jgi:hypothetical protein
MKTHMYLYALTGWGIPRQTGAFLTTSKIPDSDDAEVICKGQILANEQELLRSTIVS